MQPEHPARPSFAGKASPGPALRDRVFVLPLQTRSKAKNSWFVFDEVAVDLGVRASRPLITWLSAEQGPNEAAEFAGDGDLGLVALEPAGQQFGKAQV